MKKTRNNAPFGLDKFGQPLSAKQHFAMLGDQDAKKFQQSYAPHGVDKCGMPLSKEQAQKLKEEKQTQQQAAEAQVQERKRRSAPWGVNEHGQPLSAHERFMQFGESQQHPQPQKTAVPKVESQAFKKAKNRNKATELNRSNKPVYLSEIYK